MLNDQSPIYNSRIFKNYLEYLKRYYPNLDLDSVLKYADMSIYEINDQGHWFNQGHVDRFSEILISKTRNPRIARDVGRYASSSETLGAAKQYMLGLMNLSSVYLLMEKIYPAISKGAIIKSKKIANNKVEIISIPPAGVNEKPHQCENRLGSFESLAKWFTNSFAKIEHPECFHKGAKHCRYIISWEKTASLTWKRLRNLSFLTSFLLSAVALPFLSFSLWLDLNLLLCISIIIISLYNSHLEKRELSNIIQTQGNAAKDLLDEINIRHENTVLIHEVGQAISAILDINDLIRIVIGVIERRLNFRRGLIMLSNKDTTRLTYSASYGYNQEQKALLEKSDFHLDNPDSRGPFVIAFREQKPFMIDDILKAIQDFSERSQSIVAKLEVKSLICVPIVYEQRPLGILAVDNPQSGKSFTQSDLNLLMGVASQLAISIVNALSFQRIRESEKKYRDLVENPNSIIMRMDLEGKITFLNEFAQNFLRIHAVLGSNVVGNIFTADATGKHDFDELLSALHNDVNHQLTAETEITLKSGNKVWVTWNHKLIANEEGQFNEILSIGNDITALKKAAQEKKLLEDQLQHAQKMETLGTLAGGVAHDLNNLLSGIIGYPEMILLDLPQNSPILKSILTVKKSGEKAAAIVMDLLTLARRGVQSNEIVSLNQIVREYFTSPEFEKLKQFHANVTVEFNLAPDLLNVKGSSIHLSKALMNLVSNSAEAMPNGGTIWVATSNRHMTSQVISKETTIPEGDYVVLSVTDNGIGISESDKEKIFEPFYTKKSMGRSGTGLGMTVVWGTIMDHKGYIDIQSKLGKGTRFVLYFPATQEALPEKIGPVSIESYMGKDQSILVVDDRLDQREMAMQMLRRLNYSVNTVESGEKAINYVMKNKVDLVLLDMVMEPGIDGLETYRRMLLVNPTQKAIIFSGYSETDRVKEAQNLGAGGFLKKPFSIEKIGLMIKKELEKYTMH